MTDMTYIHNEPDGTSPFMIENQRNVPHGEDWLTYKRRVRVFKIGSKTIEETDTMREMSVDQVRDVLKHTHPELKNATVNTRKDNGQTIVEFMPRAGTKG